MHWLHFMRGLVRFARTSRSSEFDLSSCKCTCYSGWSEMPNWLYAGLGCLVGLSSLRNNKCHGLKKKTENSLYRFVKKIVNHFAPKICLTCNGKFVQRRLRPIWWRSRASHKNRRSRHKKTLGIKPRKPFQLYLISVRVMIIISV